MYYGTIKCECGQVFYFETARKKVNCILCNAEYETNSYPIKENKDLKEGE